MDSVQILGGRDTSSSLGKLGACAGNARRARPFVRAYVVLELPVVPRTNIVQGRSDSDSGTAGPVLRFWRPGAY